MTPLMASDTAVMQQCGKMYSTYCPSVIVAFFYCVTEVHVSLMQMQIYSHYRESEITTFQLVFILFKVLEVKIVDLNPSCICNAVFLET
jgi:hypothetical protein